VRVFYSTIAPLHASEIFTDLRKRGLSESAQSSSKVAQGAEVAIDFLAVSGYEYARKPEFEKRNVRSSQ
jgi:hypothetical protein